MDTIAIQAEAVLIAGVVATILHERFLGSRLEGRAAFLASVLVSLVVGAVAVYRVGGIAIGAAASGDVFATAAEILKVGGAVLLAAQAAYHVLVVPVTVVAPPRALPPAA